jgi:exoribonuclease R
MLKRGLLPEFSPAVRDEVGRISGAAGATDSTIRDLRALPWASIDNDDSRDLDQLTVAEPMAGGTVKILVAIADVDALAEQHSAIDQHASTNTTSVYTAARIFSMPPEKLSTNLTSLGQGDERLAIVMEMVVARDGTSSESDVYRALVLNHAKLAYGSVAAWLEGTGPAHPRSQRCKASSNSYASQGCVPQIFTLASLSAGWRCPLDHRWSSSPPRGCSRIGRTGLTSTQPTCAGGIFAASWMASFKSRASIR